MIVEEYQKLEPKEKENFIEIVNQTILHSHNSYPHYAIKVRKRQNPNAIQLNKHQNFPGRLLPVEELSRTDILDHKTYLLCLCDCGKWYICRSDAFKKNNSNGGCFSCGCYNKENLIKNIFNSETQEKRIKNLKNYLSDKGIQKNTLVNGWFITDLKIERKNSNHTRKYVKAICPYCKKESEWIRADGIQSNSVHSCGCATETIGEQRIRELLTQNNIPFQQEYCFENCKSPETNAYFRWDFFVNNKYLIEYDGIQHFKPCGNIFTFEKFKEIQKRDFYKNQWCIHNNITLIRIPYTHLKTIILDDLIPETSKYIYKEDLNNE